MKKIIGILAEIQQGNFPIWFRTKRQWGFSLSSMKRKAEREINDPFIPHRQTQSFWSFLQAGNLPFPEPHGEHILKFIYILSHNRSGDKGRNRNETQWASPCLSPVPPCPIKPLLCCVAENLGGAGLINTAFLQVNIFPGKVELLEKDSPGSTEPAAWSFPFPFPFLSLQFFLPKPLISKGYCGYLYITYIYLYTYIFILQLSVHTHSSMCNSDEQFQIPTPGNSSQIPISESWEGKTCPPWKIQMFPTPEPGRKSSRSGALQCTQTAQITLNQDMHLFYRKGRESMTEFGGNVGSFAGRAESSLGSVCSLVITGSTELPCLLTQKSTLCQGNRQGLTSTRTCFGSFPGDWPLLNRSFL